MLDFTGYLRLLQSAAMKGLEQVIGGLALLLLVVSLVAVYGRALGVYVW